VPRVVPIACLLLCLAGCAAPDPPQPTVCTIEKVADLPTRLVRGAVLVPAAINQTAVQMEVDTGASKSSVTPDIAIKLGLPPDATRRTNVFGVGGIVLNTNTLEQSFEVGRQLWPDQSFVTTPLARAFHEDPPVAGLLGANYLSNFDVELDVPEGRMTLWQARNCAGDFAFRGVPHWRMPLRRYTPARMAATVTIDGQPVSALIDWGAGATVLNDAVAARLGITPEMLQADPAGHGNGTDRNEIEFHVHRFSEIRVGRGLFRQVHIEVAAIHARDVDMLLGLDYARTRHLWLSYATDQLFVVPPPRPRPQANRTSGAQGPR
jgi:predicted aspartyl protease